MGYKINPWANSLPQQVQINKENIEWLRRYLPNYKGEWSATTPYNYNDVVLYNDATYVFKNKDVKDVKGVVPTDINYWQIVGRIGKDGETLPFASGESVKDTWLKGSTTTDNRLIRESEAKVIDDRLTSINQNLTQQINTKFPTADFFKTLTANLKAGNNITFDVDETAQTITINSTGGGGGSFTCDDLNSCKTLLQTIINEKFYTKTETDALLNDKQKSIKESDVHFLDDQTRIFHTTEFNEQFNNKVNSEKLNDYYTKTQVDNIASGKVDTSTLNDYYKKAETYNRTEIDEKITAKQNKGYINYNYKDGTQDREFFQTYDVEGEFKGAYSLFNWFESLGGLARTGLIASVIAIDGNDANRYMTGFAFYNKLPNRRGTLSIDLVAGQTSTCVYVGSKQQDANAKYCAQKIRIFYNGTSYAFFEAVRDESGLRFLQPFSYASGTWEAGNIDNIRFQVITIFGNNNGKINLP